MSVHDPRYHGYFECFNALEYYEAHEVLEDLWHEHRPHRPDASFYQGLIQVAGAFCHLKLHYDHPQHPKHSRRLRPSAKLFQLAAARLEAYPTHHHELDVATIISLCRTYRNHLEQAACTTNPWHPANAPQLNLITRLT